MTPNWFVALPIALPEVYRRILDRAPREVHPFHPDDVHITVAFLGAVSEEEALAAWEAAKSFALVPLSISLGKVVPLGNPRRPSALSATIEAGHTTIASAIGAARPAIERAANAKPDTRPPLPHATIARIARRADNAERRDAIAWARTIPPCETLIEVRTLALFTADETHQERRFKIVRARDLGG